MEALFPGSSSVARKFEIATEEMEGGKRTVLGPLEITPYEVIHASGAPAFALRISTDGKVIAYSGDSEWTENLLAVSAGSDLFICEAYFYDKRVPFHLDYRTLLEHRAELTARRIILTHMSQDLLARLAEIDVETAWDGLSIRL